MLFSSMGSISANIMNYLGKFDYAMSVLVLGNGITMPCCEYHGALVGIVARIVHWAYCKMCVRVWRFGGYGVCFWCDTPLLRTGIFALDLCGNRSGGAKPCSTAWGGMESTPIMSCLCLYEFMVLPNRKTTHDVMNLLMKFQKFTHEISKSNFESINIPHKHE
jgi:hypothetical protein